MEFENKHFGVCKLLQCNYENGVCLVEIKDKNRTMPFVVTSVIMKDGSWIKGEYFATLKEAKEKYATSIIDKVLNDDSGNNK